MYITNTTNAFLCLSILSLLPAVLGLRGHQPLAFGLGLEKAMVRDFLSVTLSQWLTSTSVHLSGGNLMFTNGRCFASMVAFDTN